MKAAARARVLAAVLLVLPALHGPGAFAESTSPVPDPVWDGRLWLTGQALGLKEDCTVRALFQAARFRCTSLADGTVITSTLLSQRVERGDLFLTIQTTRAGQPVEQVTLQLRGHPAEGVVSVESIRIAGAADPAVRALSYQEAVDDDDDYDLYTDTLVSLYQAFFDGQEVAARLSGPGQRR